MQNRNKEEVYPSGSRRIALFDFDGTLVEAHLWAVLLKYNLKNKERVFVSIWYFLSHMLLYYFSKAKLISQEKCFQSWVRDIPKLFNKITLESAKKTFKIVWDRYIAPTSKKNVLEKLKWHRSRKDITFIVSNAPQEFLDVVKESLKIDFVIGVKSEIKNNKFTGKIIPPLLWGEGKVKKVKEIIKKQGLKVNLKESFAYSDSLRDLPMLKLVGNPIVVDPNEKLLEIAKKNNWEVL